MFKYQQFNDLPLALSAKDIMACLGISRSGVYNLFKDPTFPSFKVGERLLVPKDKFIDWLDRKVGEEHETKLSETV